MLNINAVDSRTKFNLATKLVWYRTLEEFDDFFRCLKKAIGTQVHGVQRSASRGKSAS